MKSLYATAIHSILFYQREEKDDEKRECKEEWTRGWWTVKKKRVHLRSRSEADEKEAREGARRWDLSEPSSLWSFTNAKFICVDLVRSLKGHSSMSTSILISSSYQHLQCIHFSTWHVCPVKATKGLKVSWLRMQPSGLTALSPGRGRHLLFLDSSKRFFNNEPTALSLPQLEKSWEWMFWFSWMQPWHLRVVWIPKTSQLSAPTPTFSSIIRRVPVLLPFAPFLLRPARLSELPRALLPPLYCPPLPTPARARGSRALHDRVFVG